MNQQDTMQQMKAINRSVYGVLFVVVSIFIFIIAAINLQKNKIEEGELIANEYHLIISEKSLAVLSEISEVSLWLKNYYINHHAIEDKPILKKSYISLEVSLRDKIASFTYQLDKYIDEIRLIQNKFNDSEFKTIGLLLDKTHSRVKLEIKGKDFSDSLIQLEKVEDILKPLKTILHQLHRLHRHEYIKSKAYVNKIRDDSQKQIFALILILTIVGIASVIGLLRQVQYSLTALITANQKIEFSQARFESMFESLSDAVVVADINRNMSLLNKSVNKLFGYSNEELIGNSTSMLYADIEDFNQTGKQRYNTDAKGDPLPFEVKYRRKDGAEFWGETLGSKIVSDKGETFGFVGIIRDITERKLTEQNLENFKSTLDQTLDCVFMFDAENLNFYYVNEGALQQIGYSFNELQTMHPYDIKPDISKSVFYELIAPLISGKKASLSFETIHQHKNGQHIKVEIFLQYIAPKNETARFVAIVRDITERKHVESELRKHREHLEDLVGEKTKELHNAQDELIRKERLATLGQLTATVSHELRNPLGAMRPSLYLIEKKSDTDDEKLQSAIQRIDRNIERCDRIIDELLDFTRITELNLESICIDDWLGAVIDDQAIPKGISLEKDFSLKNIKLDIDVDRLRRAVINVVENACHAMLDDNQKLVNKEDSYLIINTGVTNKRIEITITDTGSGIKKDILGKIFEPLFSTKGFGVGLGMPTVKQIMEQHFGGIDIKSEEGKGTTVTLWLPMRVNNNV